MKIILSPAKRMKEDVGCFETTIPLFFKEATEISNLLKKMTLQQLKELYQCNFTIANQNYDRLANLDLKNRLTPAMLSYDGIAYKHLAANVLSESEIDYLSTRFVILSGLYGVLRPLDGVRPYRLELGAKMPINEFVSLYEYWTVRLQNYFKDEVVINLASEEYAKLARGLVAADKFIDIVFYQFIDGKYVIRPTEAKKMRGYMVRYMAQHKIENLDEIKKFREYEYRFNPSMSTDTKIVFVKENMYR